MYIRKHVLNSLKQFYVFVDSAFWQFCHKSVQNTKTDFSPLINTESLHEHQALSCYNLRVLSLDMFLNECLETWHTCMNTLFHWNMEICPSMPGHADIHQHMPPLRLCHSHIDVQRVKEDPEGSTGVFCPLKLIENGTYHYCVCGTCIMKYL